MSDVQKAVLAANAAYASDFGARGELGLPPARRFAVLTCMDARLDPAKYAGLREGDAHVIRNAGGRASDDAIRSLVISYKLLGTREWFVIHHTDCGMQLFDDAISFYQKLLIEHPDDTRLRFKLAVVQGRAAKVANALVDWESGLALAEASVKNLEPLVDRRPMDSACAGALADSLRFTAMARRWLLDDRDAMVTYNQRGAEIAHRAGASTFRFSTALNTLEALDCMIIVLRYPDNGSQRQMFRII